MAEIRKKPRTIAEMQQQYKKRIPEKYQGTYHKAMQGKSLRGAIRAKCQDCQNWQVAEIRRCTVVYCPLWPYRVVRKDRVSSEGLIRQELKDTGVL